MNLLRWLLLPLAGVYGSITAVRNFLFDMRFFKVVQSVISTVGVGNLSMGGTGKSVVIDFLLRHFKQQYKVAVLSRGYKRRTTGFVLANSQANADTIGDEPYQFYQKHPECTVAVSESRRKGIAMLEAMPSPPQAIFLDDVLQHRWVKPHFMIVTTSYRTPYSSDWIFPVGNLREWRSGVKRAHMVLVTKCPETLPENVHDEFRKKLKLSATQHLFFTKIAYSEELCNASTQIPLQQLQGKHFVLVTGIANPDPLVAHLKNCGLKFTHLSFPDHHRFRAKDISDIQHQKGAGIVLTTEKDYGRLRPLLKQQELWCLPIVMDFIFAREKAVFLEVLEKRIQD